MESNKAFNDNDLITEDKAADKMLIIEEVTLLNDYCNRRVRLLS